METLGKGRNLSKFTIFVSMLLIYGGSFMFIVIFHITLQASFRKSFYSVKWKALFLITQ